MKCLWFYFRWEKCTEENTHLTTYCFICFDTLVPLPQFTAAANKRREPLNQCVSHGVTSVMLHVNSEASGGLWAFVSFIYSTIWQTSSDVSLHWITLSRKGTRMCVCVARECVCACMHVCVGAFMCVRERACMCLCVSMHSCAIHVHIDA